MEKALSMKKYHILIIGFWCYHGHIREFVTNLKKKNPNVEITVAITTDSNDPEENVFSDATKVIRYKSRSSNIIRRIHKTLYYYYQFVVLWLNKGVDIIDIQYANSSIKPFMPLLRVISKNIVITPWGSDVLRVEGDKRVKSLQSVYSHANYVTVGKDTQIGKCLIEKFNVVPEKLVKLVWGGEFFDYIQENLDNITTEIAKERFGLKGRCVITCGYNTQIEQKHEEIIDAIYSVRGKLPDNLTLLFPFTYGRTKESNLYIEELLNKCKKLGLDYVTVLDHLNMPDLFKLRMATDVFVHVQNTDAGSRCVAEYVLCNKKLVHGSWIQYKYLEDYKPSCYFPVENMEQLGECIVKACQSPIEDLPHEVKEILLERSWNKRMTEWNSFFESLLEKQ